jgi:exodeoxyribonuclease VII large subunit
MSKIASVTQITQQIKILIDGEPDFADLWIEGEVSNFGRASSGHCYFTLRDSGAELRCVMWRNTASRLPWLPEQGDLVAAHGYISVYERGGAYQFYVDSIERGGVGVRWRQFLELRERLEAEGLFAPERKRSLPRWPHRIGVVTSPTGAALRDILNVLQARYPLVEVVLSPSLVQGDEAPQALVNALARLNRLDDVDFIIVARGGGSLEDLWAFNDERVARAIAASRVPVVSGVGHETDFTIADFVADLRAPTPSAAAAAVVPDRRDLVAQLGGARRAMTSLMEARLRRWREQLLADSRLLRIYEPRHLLAEYRQRLDEIVARAPLAMAHYFALWRAELRGALARLDALNPRLVLRRGYAVILDKQSGRVISGVNQVAVDQQVIIRLEDGSPEARITRVPRKGGTGK